MDERLERYAELAVRVGANVQPGQEVFLNTAVEHHDLARALTRQAYKAGASYVHALYRDGHARRAMIELGPDEALTYSPEWRKTVIRSWAGNAMIGTTGDREPDLPAAPAGEGVGRRGQRGRGRIQLKLLGETAINWAATAAPAAAWATRAL